MFVLWMVLPQLIAAGFRELYRRLSVSEDPWSEATKMGKEITQDLRKRLEE